MADFARAREKISSLPVAPFLEKICDRLKGSETRSLVLTAETAAGKSTALPIALLQHFDGKILMLETRRLAASAIADRLSDLLGEETGGTVGYRLHLDSKVSASTRLQVITEAILTRRLQEDPLLEDVQVIVLDEFHERSIHSDLALAFLKETMQLRDDLYVIVMSATIDQRAIASYLGSEERPAAVMEIPGRQYPVEITWRPGVSLSRAILDELKNGKNPSRNGGNDGKGGKNPVHNDGFRSDTILAFLPGIYEIRKNKAELEKELAASGLSAEILILHSSLSLSEQRKVLSPCQAQAPRRVILSSAIAETSLTVPGVTLVVDSGLCRINKMNVALGMEHLVTENESLFSAAQRAGRAGRVAAGRCIRLWHEHDVRMEENQPEILRADITQLLLECAEWGAGQRDTLRWLTPPSQSAWNSAADLLEKLDCVNISIDAEGQPLVSITKKGKAVLRLGLHPRLACLALAAGAEAVLPYSEYADASPERQKIFVADLQRRLRSLQADRSQAFAFHSAGENPILSGFPDRLARLSPQTETNADSGDYQFPSGRKALLLREQVLSQGLSSYPEWIVAPEVDAGERTGKIYSFSPLSQEEAEVFLQKHVKSEVKTELAGLSVQKREVISYGAIILKEKKIPAGAEDFAPALCDLVSKKGLQVLPLDEKCQSLLLRAEFYAASGEKDAPALAEKIKNLSVRPQEWLSPFIKSQKIGPQDVYDALYWFLEGNIIDAKVPLQITLANGRKRKLIYEKKADGSIQPVLEIIIQQIFGCFETPKILGVPLLLKLLSPASRPLQITDDLEHFWTGAWIDICREMKGRYPKHKWDYRISEKD